MTNNTQTYQIQSTTGLLSHSWSTPNLVRDDAAANLDLEVRIRSGDYFVTLATELDALNTRIDDRQLRAYLEDTISDLIYLQDNYSISKNKQSN